MVSDGKGNFERRSVKRGALIMREGEPASCAYLIEWGAVAVYTEHEGRSIELARLGPGEIFGEMALVSEEPRSASVKATEDCGLIVITHDVLESKLSRSDSTVQAIVRMLIHRMALANRALVRKRTNIEGTTQETREMFAGLLHALPMSQKVVFEEKVQPALKGFLDALDAFEQQSVKKK